MGMGICSVTGSLCLGGQLALPCICLSSCPPSCFHTLLIYTHMSHSQETVFNICVIYSVLLLLAKKQLSLAHRFLNQTDVSDSPQP